jgi:hypothetical protein
MCPKNIKLVLNGTHNICTDCAKCSQCDDDDKITKCLQCKANFCNKHLDAEHCVCIECLKSHCRANCYICNEKTCSGDCDYCDRSWALGCYICGKVVCWNHRLAHPGNDYDDNSICSNCSKTT